MPRIIVEQKNLWGRAGSLLDPQRIDLWQIGLSNVVNGINAVAVETRSVDPVPAVPAYFAMSVTLPELRVKPEMFRRDSRPYQMPAWDDPLDSIRMVFILDVGGEARASVIYRVLEAWRALVRAGRGSMTNGYTGLNRGSPGRRLVRLNSDYRMDYAFNIPITLLKGAVPVVNSTRAAQEAAFSGLAVSQQVSTNYFNAQQRVSESLKLIGVSKLSGTTSQAQLSVDVQLAASRAAVFNSTAGSSTDDDDIIDNHLQISGSYLLTRCWLGGFKITELNYAQNGLVSIEATLYAEDILDEAIDPTVDVEHGIIGDFPAGFGQANAPQV